MRFIEWFIRCKNEVLGNSNDIKCPVCGSTKFKIGPRGGLSINLECTCGRTYQTTPWGLEPV